MNQKLQDMSRHLADESTELLSLEDFFRIITRYKNIVIVIVIASVISAFFYTRTLPSVYRADVLMITLDISNASSLVLSESSISSLMEGKSSSGSIGIPVKQAISRIKTRKFMLRYIDSHGLKPILFPEQWNENDDAWINQEPSNEQAYKALFSMVNITKPDKHMVIHLTVAMENPNDASDVAKIANGIVDEINERVREDSIFSSEKRMTFLKNQLKSTDVLQQQVILYKLIENQLNIAMVKNDQGMFVVLDPAITPVKPNPKPILMIIFTSFIAALFIAITIVFFYDLIRRKRYV